MGQRTQLHIKKNNEFYVIHDQWGYGQYMLRNVAILLKLDVEQLGKIFEEEGDMEYYSVEHGDNNNGYFLIDHDKKLYCFLPGNEDIQHVRYDISVRELQPLNAKEYITIYEDFEQHLNFAMAIDKHFKNMGYELFTCYKFQDTTKNIDLFFNESDEYEKKNIRERAFFARDNEEKQNIDKIVFNTTINPLIEELNK